MTTHRTHPRLWAPLALLVLLHGAPAAATNSPIELRTALKTLMVWLPGQFDSEPQRFFEEEYKTPKELVHGRVYRSFTRIDAPTLGDNVLVAQVRYGGRDGRFDAGEFQVWTLTVDGEKRAIRMTPQRFKLPANYQDVATDPARFAGLSAADLLPAEGAAGCTIWWRLSGKQLRGATEPGVCRTVRTATKTRTELLWDWEYVLNDEELWINFAGRDTAGNVVYGRADQTHWRLGKARDFECFLSYRPGGQTEPQVFNGFTMHDRGDVYRLTLKDSRGAVPVFIGLIRGMWPSNSGRNYVDLLRMQVYEGRTEDKPDSWKLIGNSIGSADTDRVGFSSATLSSRCKLRQPGPAAPVALAALPAGVLVFGATGALGSDIVKQLVARKEAVTVFVREGSARQRIDGLNVEYVVGDVMVAESVAAAFKGRRIRAVVDATAKRGGPNAFTYEGAMRNIVTASRTAGVGHLLIASSIGVGRSAAIFAESLTSSSRDNLLDKERAEQLLIASGLRYTILRNGALDYEGAVATGKARLSEDEKVMGRITRPDLAALTVGCIDSPACANKLFHAVDDSLVGPRPPKPPPPPAAR